jgi:hypothetical protein
MYCLLHAAVATRGEDGDVGAEVFDYRLNYAHGEYVMSGGRAALFQVGTSDNPVSPAQTVSPYPLVTQAASRDLMLLFVLKVKRR